MNIKLIFKIDILNWYKIVYGVMIEWSVTKFMFYIWMEIQEGCHHRSEFNICFNDQKLSFFFSSENKLRNYRILFNTWLYARMYTNVFLRNYKLNLTQIVHIHWIVPCKFVVVYQKFKIASTIGIGQSLIFTRIGKVY